MGGIAGEEIEEIEEIEETEDTADYPTSDVRIISSTNNIVRSSIPASGIRLNIR